MTTSRTASPLVAALLSSLCSGLGQLYCGRRTRALTLLGGSLLFAPVVLTAAWALPANSRFFSAARVASLFLRRRSSSAFRSAAV